MDDRGIDHRAALEKQPARLERVVDDVHHLPGQPALPQYFAGPEWIRAFLDGRIWTQRWSRRVAGLQEGSDDLSRDSLGAPKGAREGTIAGQFGDTEIVPPPPRLALWQSLREDALENKKALQVYDLLGFFRCSGGQGGIRTRVGMLSQTRFPGVRLKPLIHLSGEARHYSPPGENEEEKLSGIQVCPVAAQAQMLAR